MGWIIVGVISVVGIIVMISMMAARSFATQLEMTVEKSDEDDPTPSVPQGSEGLGLGAPIFDNGPNNAPITSFLPKMTVWCPTPIGILRGVIERDTIDCGDYVVIPRLSPNFFSQAMANKLDIKRNTWIVDDIRKKSSSNSYKGGNSGIIPLRSVRASGASWIREHSIFGDFLDIMIEELWFELMFCDFYEPIEYYEGLEAVFADDGGFEAWNEAEVDTTFAEAIKSDPEPVPEPVEAIKPEPEPDPTPEPMEATKPEPVPEPEPAHYEPPEPHYEPPSDSYDSGDSYSDDSGGGGFDD